jgi:ferredoxin
MAYTINDLCSGCYACEPLCPEGAISRSGKRFVIEHALCSECEGHHADAQCASICPIEGAIVDGDGVALNPPGTLTGIPTGLVAA